MSHPSSRRNMLRTMFGGLSCLGLTDLLVDKEARAATAGNYSGPRLPGSTPATGWIPRARPGMSRYASRRRLESARSISNAFPW